MTTSYEPIAIVGRACVLPSAPSPLALWELVAARRSAVREVPDGRFGLSADLVSGTPKDSVDKTWSTAGGYVLDDGVAALDFPGRSDVAGLDPLFRWTLGTAHASLVDAGYDAGLPSSLRGGFVFGNLSFPTEAMTRLGETLAVDDAWRAATGRGIGDRRDRFMSGLPALLAQQHLGLHAFGHCLDAACASSLYAVHLAARALQMHRADVVVAGAVNRADALFLHVGFCALQAMSSSGTPRPFDKKADGLVPAEGAAALTLMRLSDAQREGRAIHGVIVGSGLSNDGRSRNLLAPSSEGQARAIRAAWQAAGLSPSRAQLFECHATGTQTGDRAEVTTLSEVVPTGGAAIPLGSLKSNLGHLITAAGAAGLIKVVEAFRHEQLPPTIHVDDPIDIVDGSRFRLQTELAAWQRPHDDVRRAGVSAFGFGGNDAHVVVEEHAATRRFAIASAGVPARASLPPVAVVAVGARVGDLAGGLSAIVGALSSPTPSVTSECVVDTDGVRFPPNDLKASLAQQLLVLEAARDATRPFGDDVLPRERTGVFIGMGCDVGVTTPGLRWRAEDLLARAAGPASSLSSSPSLSVSTSWSALLHELRDRAMPAMGAAGVLGTMPNIPANRMNLQLDLRGPGFTVSSEERSGLDALDVARTLLWSNEIDAALVGATDAAHDPRHKAAMGPDARATGDAAVVLVVMREERARALQLPILGVIDDAEEAARTTYSASDVDAFVGATHAASGLLAVAASLSAPGTSVVETTPMHAMASPTDRRSTRTRVRTTPLPRKRRDDVAFMFGPVTPTRSLAQPWLAFPAVRATLDRVLGNEALPLSRGERGKSPAERDLFIASSSSQARCAFVRDALGLHAGHHLGISMGENNALVAAGVWTDPIALIDDTINARIFSDDIGGPLHAVRAMWQARGRADLGASWETVVLRAPRAQIEAALAARDDVFAMLWHFDDELVAAGAPDGIAAVARALNTAPIVVQDAPAVHTPAVAHVADRYRAVHTRQTHATDVTIWSGGVDDVGGPMTRLDSASCAEAMVQQAARTVDIPALLKKMWAAGVRHFIDCSPRGLLAQWAQQVLPQGNVIAVDGDPVVVARRLAAHDLGDATLLSRFERSVASPARALRVPAHPLPRAWPSPDDVRNTLRKAPTMPEKMTPPPRLPRITPIDASVDAPSKASHARTHTTSVTTTPAASMHASASAIAAQASIAPEPAMHPVAPIASPSVGAPAMPVVMSGVDDDVLAALQAQRDALLEVHTRFLQTQAQAHARFLAARQTSLAQLAALAGQPAAFPTTSAHDVVTGPILPARAPAPVAAAPVAATPVAATPSTTKRPDVLWDRRDLEVLASERISKVLGPMFARQDGFRRQVRMPQPPLLLADRVLSTTASAGVLEKGKQLVTQTDVRADAWYLHEDRIPAGVLIETGQADLLLISYMGVDFENRGERVYRLLGCDLTYRAHLPAVGDVLHHDIVIDGFATANVGGGTTRIFFFHSDTRIGGPDGPIVLQVRNGQAGFFNDEELKNSGGILWKPADEKADAIAALRHDVAERFTSKKALSRADLEAFARGDTWACFGDGFEIARTQVRSPRIDAPRTTNDAFGNPDGRFIDMLLIDRVTDLSVDGGPWGRGHLRAELDLHDGKWFYDGHFKDDPCMPGTIMFQGCLQVASTYLAACGFTLSRDGFRFEPTLGAEMPLRCRGQATPSSRNMVYELFVKSVQGGLQPKLRCDILVTVDGLKSLHCKDVELSLVSDWPLTSRQDLQGKRTKLDGRDAIAPHSVVAPNANTPIIGFRSLLATGIGRPGEAFPGLYDVYDDGARVARLPGPPYHFMSSVDDVKGPGARQGFGILADGGKPEGTRAVVRYDVPADAWYFDEAKASQGARMPFAVLLEVALQPCGWLSSYVGSTRTTELPLSYRNLDGKATQHREVGRDVGALFTTATMTKSSSSSGMIIQEFTFEVTAADGSAVFSGSTVFGFFPPEALVRQVGVGSSDAERARLAERCPDAAYPFELRTRPSTYFDGALALPPPVGAPTLLMIDRVEGVWRDARTNLPRVRTAKDVVVDDWFFQAHFFQDPVQPGSLGIEAMVQALQWVAIHEGVASGMKRPRFEALATGLPLVWKYRGQVVPKNRLIQVEADVTRIDRTSTSATIVADCALWVDGLRIYLGKGLAVRVVDDG